MMRKMYFIFIGAFIILMTGCEAPGTPTPPPPPMQVWINEPQDGALLPLNEPYLLKFQGASFTGIEEFEVVISDAGFSTVVAPLSTGSGGPTYGTIFYSEAIWTPSSVGNYTIMVRARNADLQYSSFAEAHVTVEDSIVAVLTAVLTPASIEVAPSPTPTKAPWYVFTEMNANCRAGPGTAYNETSFVPKDYRAEVVGRNEEGTWLNLLSPNGTVCWASIIAFEIEFDVGMLTVTSAPPAPSSSNGEETEITGCTVTNPLNNETHCISPCPSGAVPGKACTP